MGGAVMFFSHFMLFPTFLEKKIWEYKTIISHLIMVATGTGKPGKPGKWPIKIPGMEKSWNLKKMENIMEKSWNLKKNRKIMEKSWNFIRMEKCMTPENNCASFFVVTASNHNYVNHYTIGLLHCTDRRHFIVLTIT